jgi:sporulation protein YlmC with PRC-barrel domain
MAFQFQQGTIATHLGLSRPRIEETPVRFIPAVILAVTLATPVAMAQNSEPAASGPSAAAAPVSAAGKWRASKLVGVNIYNQQNDKIGEIDDVIIDGSGKVDGVVVSVGGFLGMGEHDVMMKMNQIKFANKARTTTTGATSSDSKQWYPDRGTVNATKDKLKAMPQFKY